jgi:hypothetical protein
LLQVTLKFHAEVEVKFLAHTTTDGAGWMSPSLLHPG